MGDRLQAGKPLRSTQPGHPSVSRRNEYQRKLGRKQAHYQETIGPRYSRVIFILDAVVVCEFDGLVAESMHPLIDHLSMLLVTTVDVQLVLCSAVQPASQQQHKQSHVSITAEIN